MKNLLSIFLLVFLFHSSVRAQLGTEKDAKATVFNFAYKIQPVQLITQNMKLAIECALNKKSSLEFEGSYRTRGLFSENRYKEPTFYGLARYKYYFSQERDQSLAGYYFAPFIIGGSSQRSKAVWYGAKQIGGKLNSYTAYGFDLGIQTIFARRTVIDCFVGAGLSTNSYNTKIGLNNSHSTYNGLALRLGFRIGIAHG